MASITSTTKTLTSTPNTSKGRISDMIIDMGGEMVVSGETDEDILQAINKSLVEVNQAN